ncbi:MAG: hypothetical protein BWK72_20725 [Rhodoferax ferrireducens]|uniref:Ribbon-helix-helix domain-containing protein n=1 Tax=Rhodoferax ferrireducens TaxID=192843 RepID=A0A1W9KNL4_9BURK|nr:MAG: hypothetical protein BWK72_20725 [Rhodoferax ferrireducens]
MVNHASYTFLCPDTYCDPFEKNDFFRLEKQFWVEIDRLAKKAGRSWQQWVITELANKPESTSAASWLRVRCLQSSLKGRNHG